MQRNKTKIVECTTLQKKKRKVGCIMRKFVLTLAVVLLAVPAWAGVKITAVDEGGGVVAINYEITSGAKARAFALDITVSAGTIDAISDYVVGESTAAAKGYGVFPANFARFITVDPDTGDVADWDVNDYTPVADPCDSGAQGGLGTSGITVEMGALYSPTDDGSVNAPGATGTLCKVTVSADCNLTVAENQIRGGVVLTDPAVAADVDLTGAVNVPIVLGPGECFPAAYSTYNDWVAMGSPSCWCAPPDGTGYQCDGDADGKTSGFPFNYRVFTGDLTLIVNNWKAKIDTADPCADIDHKDSGFPFKYRVFTQDLSILVANWKAKDSALPGDCPRAE
jgi:hypothetical protein